MTSFARLTAVAALCWLSGCDGDVVTGANAGTGGASAGGSSSGGAFATGGSETSGGASTGGLGGAGGDLDPEPELFGAPLVFATERGLTVSAVVASGTPAELAISALEDGTATWLPPTTTTVESDVVRWSFDGLLPGTSHTYRITSNRPSPAAPLFSGQVTTRREPGAEYTFALLTDTHIAPRVFTPNSLDVIDFPEQTLLNTARALIVEEPDFVMHLGDVLDFHLFGFNDPPPDSSWARLAYLNYRRLMGDLLGNTSHYRVMGNWDGENGCNTDEERDRSRIPRLLYLPGPGRESFPEGGSEQQDYYAFTWGDALFVVLNVMTYTPTPHRLYSEPTGLADDWTLGEAQLAWLEDTLLNASSKWRFLFIHHTVGGAAGDNENSAYGRGGGQAARVGEQAKIHDLMLRHGVQVFFYAHDHVFADMVVDGIHYTLPGSAGAPWKFPPGETGYTRSWPDSGYARVRVSPQTVAVELVSLENQVLHGYVLE